MVVILILGMFHYNKPKMQAPFIVLFYLLAYARFQRQHY
jgi:hypothetical protein